MTEILYYPHAIYAPGLLTLTQLSDMEPDHGFQELTEFAAGQVGPQYTGAHMAAPSNRFSTSQLKSLLDAVTDFGICRDLSGVDVYTQYKAGQNLGTRQADDNGGVGGNHLFARMQENAGLFVESITVRQGGIAEARCRLVALYKSQTGNDPLVWSADNDITVVSDVSHLYTLGPTKINGTFLDGVNEATLENNIEYEEEASAGEGFLTYIGVRSYRPVLTLKTRNTAALATFGTRGTALTALSWFLRKKLKSAISVLDATAENILFSSTTGTIHARKVSGAQAVAEVAIHLTSSAQNTAAYTINTTSAVS